MTFALGVYLPNFMGKVSLSINCIPNFVGSPERRPFLDEQTNLEYASLSCGAQPEEMDDFSVERRRRPLLLR